LRSNQTSPVCRCTAFAQAACQGLGGDIGDAILENAAAIAAFQTAYTALQNVPEKIKIEQERVGQIANVRKGTAEALGALEIAKGFANAFSFSTSVDVKLPPGVSVSVNFNPGSIVTGFCDAEARMLEAMQEVQIEGIDSVATIKLYLLDMAEQAQALREYEIRVKQTKLKIDNLHKRLLALVEEWRQSLDNVAESVYANPAYRLEMEDSVRQANIRLQRAQVKCFLAARALSYDWADEFSGVVLIDPLYNGFDSSWSVFELTDVYDVQDFDDALDEWDAWERYDNPNPCIFGEDYDQIISLRQDILGFSDWTKPESGNPEQYPPEVLEENKRLFKKFIRDHTEDDDCIRFEFGTSVADESLFIINISGDIDVTNVKIAEIAVNLQGNLIIDPNKDQSDMGLSLAGMSTVRQCGADWPGNDSLVQYDLEGFGNAALRTILLQPHIGGFPTEPNPTNWNDGLTRLSVAATAWKVEINKNGTNNKWLNWNEFTDIQFKIKFWYGQPPALECGESALQEEELAEDANSTEPNL